MQGEGARSVSRFFELDPTCVALGEIGSHLWGELFAAAGQLGHPWSLMTLATVSGSGPAQRTVVLRGVDQAQGGLVAYSDVRAPKVAQIEQCPSVSCLFYHPEHRVQVALAATAEIHHGDLLAEDCWRQTAIPGRRNYLGILPPGSVAIGPSTNLHPDLQSGELLEGDTEFGRKHFAVIQLVVRSIDLLWLRREGNFRAKFTRQADGWEQCWVEP